MAVAIKKVNEKWFSASGINRRNPKAKRQLWVVWRMLIEYEYYYVRFEGDPSITEGQRIILYATNFSFCNLDGAIQTDQTFPSAVDGDWPDGNALPDPNDPANYPRLLTTLA